MLAVNIYNIFFKIFQDFKNNRYFFNIYIIYIYIYNFNIYIYIIRNYVFHHYMITEVKMNVIIYIDIILKLNYFVNLNIKNL